MHLTRGKHIPGCPCHHIQINRHHAYEKPIQPAINTADVVQDSEYEIKEVETSLGFTLIKNGFKYLPLLKYNPTEVL